MVETTISVQTLGIGVSAFVATLIAAFLFINAYKETVARAFAWGVVGLVVWAWFGFFSAIAADDHSMQIARQLRLIGVIGNILFLVLFVRFAFIYKAEREPLTSGEQLALKGYTFAGAAFIALAVFDIFGGQTLVGTFFPNTVSPIRGSMFEIFVIYYLCNIPLIATMMRRRLLRESGSVRRGGVILLSTMMFSVLLGSTGFLPYFGITVPALTLLRGLAVPLFGVGAFYAMSTHNIFNFRVAAANTFVFAIWSFLFFRILLNPSLSAAVPDILLLAALIVLGVLLIRSFNSELDNRLKIERAERESAIDQSKAEFISIAAHQLRTPLSGIRWAFNVLETAPGGMTPEQRGLVKRASERTRDVVERVNEMLRAGRYNGGGTAMKLTGQDIRPVLKESIALFEGAAQARSLELKASIPRKVLFSRIDKDKFAIAVQNIIDNAIKYTKSGSISLSAELIGRSIEIRITDTGIGITNDDTAHLFEKFYRNENAKKMFTDGSGLGLFIVKKIIDAHGGTVTVDSYPRAGSTFTIRIPVAKNG